MKYVFDLDGTLCTEVNGDYESAQPIEDRILMVNKLFDEGNKITIFTARGMNTFDNNQFNAIQKYYSLTEAQLKQWKVKYHHLILGKPSGDFYIDDKGINHEDYFGTNVRP
jgi:capsule biosynthesis phosphatase